MTIDTMTFWLVVAMRFLRRLGRVRITFAAIVLSSAVMVVVLALLSGVGEAMVRNAVNVQSGHVQASWGVAGPPGAGRKPHAEVAAFAGRAKALPGVQAVLPRSRSTGLLTSPKEPTLHTITILYGVEPQPEAARTLVPRKLLHGRYVRTGDDLLLGKPAADALMVGVGDTVTFRDGGLKPHRFRVCGIFATGLDEMDRLLSYGRLGDCPSDSQEVSVFLADGAAPQSVRDALAPQVPASGRVETWQEMMPDLVQLLGVERAAGNVVVFLVAAILALGISNTVYVSVSQRTRELGILKAIGVRPGGIVLLVVADAALLTLLGAALGVGLGTAVVWLMREMGGLDVSPLTDMNPLFSGSNVIYPELGVRAVVLPLATVIVAGTLAAFAPAWRAGRIQVASALRQI